MGFEGTVCKVHSSKFSKLLKTTIYWFTVKSNWYCQPQALETQQYPCSYLYFTFSWHHLLGLSYKRYQTLVVVVLMKYHTPLIRQ